MEASDLRVGVSWVDYRVKGNPIQIVVNDLLEFAKKDAKIINDIYLPITLTEEIHNKIGVIKNGFDSFEYVLPRKNNIKMKVVFHGDYVFLRQAQSDKRNEDDIVSIWNKDLTGRDMYVHEWQNLYQALTGEELNIEL